VEIDEGGLAGRRAQGRVPLRGRLHLNGLVGLIVAAGGHGFCLWLFAWRSNFGLGVRSWPADGGGDSVLRWSLSCLQTRCVYEFVWNAYTGKVYFRAAEKVV
jgi:hypothetical protein